MLWCILLIGARGVQPSVLVAGSLLHLKSTVSHITRTTSNNSLAMLYRTALALHAAFLFSGYPPQGAMDEKRSLPRLNRLRQHFQKLHDHEQMVAITCSFLN